MRFRAWGTSTGRAPWTQALPNRRNSPGTLSHSPVKPGRVSSCATRPSAPAAPPRAGQPRSHRAQARLFVGVRQCRSQLAHDWREGGLRGRGGRGRGVGGARHGGPGQVHSIRACGLQEWAGGGGVGNAPAPPSPPPTRPPLSCSERTGGKYMALPAGAIARGANEIARLRVVCAGEVDPSRISRPIRSVDHLMPPSNQSESINQSHP